MQTYWATELFLVTIALLAAALAIATIAFLERRSKRQPVTAFAEDTTATVFLFDGETLVDSTPSARALLANSALPGKAWAKLSAALAPHFSDLDEKLTRLPVEGSFTIYSTLTTNSPLLLQAELRGGLTRLLLADPSQHGASTGQDLMA